MGALEAVLQEEGENIAFYLANQRQWRRAYPGAFVMVDEQRLVHVACTASEAQAARRTPAGVVVKLAPYPRRSVRRRASQVARRVHA